MIKRVCAWVAVFCLLFCLTAAQAATYPERRGAVNDDAAVLSDSVAADVDALNGRSSAQFTVVTRHFLGGADAQTYCDGLFDAWGLGDHDFLLLLVIGEERYAVAMGAQIKKNALSSEQLNTLFSAKLRQPFIQDRDYDGAVGSFLLAAASQIARAEGNTLNTAGLFGTSQSAASNTASNSAGSSWFDSWTSNGWSAFFSDDDLNGSESGSQNYQYSGGSGFSTGKLILIIFILFIILRNRHRRGDPGQPGRRPPRR